MTVVASADGDMDGETVHDMSCCIFLISGHDFSLILKVKA